jgi:hypothetical protein
MNEKDIKMAQHLNDMRLRGVTLETVKARLFGWEQNRLLKIEAHKEQLEQEYFNSNPDVVESRFCPDISLTDKGAAPRNFEETVADLFKFEAKAMQKRE